MQYIKKVFHVLWDNYSTEEIKDFCESLMLLEYLYGMRISLLLILFLIANCSYGQEFELGDKAFVDGEEVVYKVYYNWNLIWVPAGEVTFLVEEKNDHYELKVTGKSYPSYDSFFKVRDYYVSRVDKESLLPFNFRRDILEGRYKRYDSLEIDQSAFSVLEYFGKSKVQAKEFQFSLDDTVLDMVSAIYYLRSLPVVEYPESTIIPFRIFFDKEHFNLDIHKRKTKTRRIKNMGKAEAIHLQLGLIDGYVFKEGDVMDIWISNCKNRLPLLIESPISFGSVKAVLKSVKNLKHPFNYDVKIY